ncbi:MAG: ParA family protein [Hungatella sp.]|jgi:chromosome partitioning protein|nr:ParA family protein [Hungatella sp.]
MGKTIAVANRKGGVGKTMTSVNLAVGLANQGKRVLCIDADPQHSLTVSLGVPEPDKLPVTLGTVMTSIISEESYDPISSIVRHSEGVDLFPANNSLSGLELTLIQAIGRESVLRQYLDTVKEQYDYQIIDCSPNLGLLTLNALAAADSVIIPVVPKYLDAKGLELLLKTIAQVKRQLNPNLTIGGILLTMVDRRANFTREIISLIENAYGGDIKIFGKHIPQSVRAAETSANGKSIFSHDPKGKVAAAYTALVGEVLNCA